VSDAAAHSTVATNAESTPSPAPAPQAAPPASPLSDPELWVERYGDFLFKSAMLRLRDPAQAEDAVQETFLAALKSGRGFAGRSTERTWLVGILKNKIADYYRQASREAVFTDLDFYADEERASFVAGGPRAGAWLEERGPQTWPNPGEGLDKEAFWQVFRDCSGKLPRKVAAVFNLRELDDLSSPEICRRLDISEQNLWVMLHRARMALRRCLEIHWFAKTGDRLCDG
jgi:RNA polymerase sigma-70 factor (ECF subfamily)